MRKQFLLSLTLFWHRSKYLKLKVNADKFKPHYFLFVVAVIYVAINHALQYTSQWLIYLPLFLSLHTNAND